MQPAESKKLPVIEELAPRAVSVIQNLASVVAVSEFQTRECEVAGCQFFRAALIGSLIFLRNRQINLLIGTVQHKLGKLTVLRRTTKCLGRLGDGEYMATTLASCRRSSGRAFLWIERLMTIRTFNMGVFHVRRENPATAGAADSHFR